MHLSQIAEAQEMSAWEHPPIFFLLDWAVA
jgi:hypothetical protein